MNNNELKALVSLLEDPDVEIYNHVSEKILSLGSSIIDFLEEEWSKYLNPVVQDRIETLIYQLQVEQRVERMMEWKATEEQDLLTGLWLVSTIQYPEYELKELKNEIELLFLEVWQKFDIKLSGREAVSELNRILFTELNFKANTKNFHSSENSMMKSVLNTRRGNPISLAMVYMLIGKKFKMPISGVNLPNLFVLTFIDEQEQFYINVFNKGLIFTKDDIENYVDQLNLEPRKIFFSPCSSLEIIKRFLRNLIAAYDKNGQKEKKEEVRNLLMYLSGED